MNHSGAYVPYLEQLVEFASHGELEVEIRAAREDYFVESGELREDEPSFEARMEGFTEWYVLERPLGDGARTPLDLFLAQRRAELSADEIEVYEGFRNTRRSLFEFLKVRGEHLLTRDLATGKKEAIFERRRLAGVDKGALIDARALQFRGEQIFTRSQVYHPLEVRKLILGEIKRVRKQSPGEFSGLLQKLALARLRYDRYRRVDVARLYRQVLDGERPAP